MPDEAYELAVALEPDGMDETQAKLEETEATFDETADSVEESADEMEGFSQQWRGAMTAITAGLAVAAAGLLSKVPVIGEAMSSLNAIITAVAFQMDKVLRPVLTPLTKGMFKLADAIFKAEGPLGTLIGVLGTVAAALAGALAAAAGLGAILPNLTMAGAVGAVVGALKSLVSTVVGIVAGSLAAAAALGTFLGLIGVGILEITGILDAVRKFGETLAKRLPAWARDGMLALIGIFGAPLAVIGAAIAGFVKGTLKGGLQEGIALAIENAKEVLGIFITAWRNTLNRITTMVTNLIDDAKGWGKQLIDELVAGIRAKIGEVKEAANAVARAARERLPGSPAETGPLSDLDRTGPAFVETFAAGIEGGVGRVGSAANAARGAAAGGGGGSGGGGQLADLVAAMQNNEQTTVLELDGREVARSTDPFLGEETATRGRGTR